MELISKTYVKTSTNEYVRLEDAFTIERTPVLWELLMPGLDTEGTGFRRMHITDPAEVQVVTAYLELARARSRHELVKGLHERALLEEAVSEHAEIAACLSSAMVQVLGTQGALLPEADRRQLFLAELLKLKSNARPDL